uniref:C2H2-type domain-containing protein n=1 Tax=Mycena chlorophos TaxID=658473 RepID=A0ABQ0L903_MYCCL|nr:predicted protein [Mycena chlorophos]
MASLKWWSRRRLVMTNPQLIDSWQPPRLSKLSLPAPVLGMPLRDGRKASLEVAAPSSHSKLRRPSLPNRNIKPAFSMAIAGFGLAIALIYGHAAVARLGELSLVVAQALPRDASVGAVAVAALGLAAVSCVVVSAVNIGLRLRRLEQQTYASRCHDVEAGPSDDADEKTPVDAVAQTYFACVDCPRVFDEADLLAYHLEDDHRWEQHPLPPPPRSASAQFSCMDCPFVSFNPADLRNHMQTVHFFQYTIGFACVDCSATFGEKLALRMHMEDVHAWTRAQQRPISPFMPGAIPLNIPCSIPGCDIMCLGWDALDSHMYYQHGVGMPATDWSRAIAASAGAAVPNPSPTAFAASASVEFPLFSESELEAPIIWESESDFGRVRC